MPKYEVKLHVTRELEKPISVWASDESEAEEKAAEVVERWPGVLSAEAVDVSEV